MTMVVVAAAVEFAGREDADRPAGTGAGRVAARGSPRMRRQRLDPAAGRPTDEDDVGDAIALHAVRPPDADVASRRTAVAQNRVQAAAASARAAR